MMCTFFCTYLPPRYLNRYGPFTAVARVSSDEFLHISRRLSLLVRTCILPLAWRASVRRNRSITFACVALPVIRQWAGGLRGRVILLAVYFAPYRIFCSGPVHHLWRNAR